MYTQKFINFFNKSYGKFLLFLFSFLFLILLILNNIGLSFRQKIIIDSTLDFSWFTDIIERMLHGYVLGKDFIFTYGPLFQYIYSLPSLIFHVPSYISFALSPLISFIIIFFLFVIIASFLTKNSFEQIAYIFFVFIPLGLLTSSGTDTIKAFIPICYSFLFYFTIKKEFSWIRIIFISILPSLFGFYTYNLFFTTIVISFLLSVFVSLKNRIIGKNLLAIWINLPLIVFFHIIFSFALAHNLNYITDSLEAISNYRYELNLPWTTDRINILLIFPMIILFLTYYIWKTKNFSSAHKETLLLFIFTALIELDYLVSRSDAGHLLYALLPSIIAFYTVVFFSYKKIPWIAIFGIILYVFVPFKPNFSDTYSLKNVITVYKIIHQKPAFFQIYTLPDDYYFKENEINYLAQFVQKNKGNILIYPYDSFILNMEESTFNTYALALYLYSNSPVEEKTIRELARNKPKYIILDIDTKGALNLDNIPNFTRNPLFTKWLIDNYTISKKSKKYLILQYSGHKNTFNSSCDAYKLKVNLSLHETIPQKILDMIKPPIYYWNYSRLPYNTWSKSYTVFPEIYSETNVTSLFNNSSNVKNKDLLKKMNKTLYIIRVSPFTGSKEKILFNTNEYTLNCL